MKKFRALLALNIVQAVLLIAAIVVAILLMPSIMLFNNPDSIPSTVITGTEADVYNGYASVTSYGAVPNDGKDDTQAFLKAAKTGAGVYVPLGTFNIKETIELNGQALKGAGTGRSVICYKGSGAITKASGAAVIEDITLSFAEDSITGNENEGEMVAVYDNGLTNGAMLRTVKLVNVGTGYYRNLESSPELALTIESLEIDKFSYKAIDVKDATSTLIRSTYIKQAIGEVDSAVRLGGSFTIESLVFSGTQSKYPLEFANADSAVVKTLIFDNATATSGCFIRCASGILSMQTITVKDSKGSSLIEIEDSANGIKSVGNLISLYDESGIISVVDKENRIVCENIISQ